MSEPTHEVKEQAAALLLAEDAWLLTVERVAGLGPGTAAAVAELIGERPHDTKFTERAVLALGVVGGAPEAELLEALLGDPEPMIRIAALTALREIGDARHVPPVSTLLEDPASAVRKEAVKTLAQLGGADSVEALRRVAQHDPEAFLREQAGRAAVEAQRRSAPADGEGHG